MDTQLLEKTARELVAAGKGILAADESNGTMSNRLQAVGVSASSDTRNAYRANLFSANGYEEFISGVISVSYTHLRAHETVLDLVCRLLLEKKK